MVDPLLMQFVKNGLNEALTGLVRAAADPNKGPLNAPKLGLFTAWPGFNLDLVLADLTECAFTGYAQFALVFGAPTYDPDKRPCIYAGSHEFLCTAPGVSETVIGAFITDGAAVTPKLVAVALFSNPVVIAVAGDAVDLTAKIAIPGTAAPEWGIGSVVQ